jgi:hypothetical protein
MPLAIEADAYSDKDLNEMIDAEIAEFNRYFQSIGNDPLIKFEIAAIKTFLMWKTHGEQRAPSEAEVSGETDGEKNAEATGG